MKPVRDITLPDGTVRHNVGSDNLSDEDRAAMCAEMWMWIDAKASDRYDSHPQWPWLVAILLIFAYGLWKGLS